MSDLVQINELEQAFPEANEDELFDALYRLERLGLVDVSVTRTHFRIE